MTPLEEFHSDPQNRIRLADLLADPVFVKAVALVKRKMEPLTGTPADRIPELAISAFHQAAGCNKLLDELAILTQPLSNRKPVQGRRLATENDLNPPA